MCVCVNLIKLYLNSYFYFQARDVMPVILNMWDKLQFKLNTAFTYNNKYNIKKK